MEGETKNKRREGAFHSFFVDTEHKVGKEGAKSFFFSFDQKKGAATVAERTGMDGRQQAADKNTRERVLADSSSPIPISQKTSI